MQFERLRELEEKNYNKRHMRGGRENDSETGPHVEKTNFVLPM